MIDPHYPGMIYCDRCQSGQRATNTNILIRGNDPPLCVTCRALLDTLREQHLIRAGAAILQFNKIEP